MNMRAPVSVRPDLDVYIGAESRARGWSVYGAERSQPVATSRKWDVAENGLNDEVARPLQRNEHVGRL